MNCDTDAKSSMVSTIEDNQYSQQESREAQILISLAVSSKVGVSGEAKRASTTDLLKIILLKLVQFLSTQ